MICARLLAYLGTHRAGFVQRLQLLQPLGNGRLRRRGRRCAHPGRLLSSGSPDHGHDLLAHRRDSSVCRPCRRTAGCWLCRSAGSPSAGRPVRSGRRSCCPRLVNCAGTTPQINPLACQSISYSRVFGSTSTTSLRAVTMACLEMSTVTRFWSSNSNPGPVMCRSSLTTGGSAYRCKQSGAHLSVSAALLTRADANAPHTPGEAGAFGSARENYLMILVTRPAPTVRPPSRIANRRPSSMATGWISFTTISVLSPGITISVPSGNVTTPVTSVVRK